MTPLRPTATFLLAATAMVAHLGCPVLLAQAQDDDTEEGEPPGVSLESDGPAELIERGRSAFAASDFAAAEKDIGKFIADYGEAEEAAEAVRALTPLLAISKVGLRKFGEALEWIDQSLADPELAFHLRDELRFWKATCLAATGELVDAQHAFGAYWAEKRHQPFKRYEALLMFGTLYIQQDFPEYAADFFAEQVPKIREKAPEAASRCVVLQFHARLLSDQPDRALALLRAEYPDLADMTQVISFQTLALQLGARFLEEKQWHKAIAAFQRVQRREKLLGLQRAKLEKITDRVTELEGRPRVQSALFQLGNMQRRVERELANFEKIEHFDSALRLRLASAFQGLGRYREAALVMEDMLATLPPDEVVESATLAQIQCWMEIGRWPKAVEAAEAYVETFGDEGPSLATVLFLRAEAFREMREYGDAQLAYGEVVEKFPGHEFAPKALFLQGFLYLQQDDNEGALFQFDQVERHYPDSPMAEDADYWTGMAHSFSKQYQAAREHMRSYLDRHEPAKYGKEAAFRIAVCTFSLAEYPESIALFEEFIEEYPGDPLCDEAHLLLGDAWLGEGEVDKGFAAYDRVRPESRRFFEDAWFKKGKAYKLLEEFGTMRQHYQRFIDEHPDSNRMPEAVYWVGWTHLRDGETDKAQKIYWEVIDEHGADPERHSIADVFAALPKVYRDEGEAGTEELLSRLELMKTSAARSDQPTLALRCAWAKSRIMAKKSPAVARAELLAAANEGWADPKRQSPRLTVEAAEALLDAGNLLTAKELFTDIRKWHPRAVVKDRIFAALGKIAEEEGDTEKAVAYYERFEREAATSLRLAEIQLRRARLLAERGETFAVRSTLESILENPTAPAAIKAESIYELGRSHLDADEEKKAIVYFERLYVAYGKFGELNAKAYWERGQALEKLQLPREALETYRELAAREDLRRFEQARKAGEKIARLEAIVPPEPGPGAEGSDENKGKEEAL